MKTPKRPVALMTLAQVICGLAALLVMLSAMSLHSQPGYWLLAPWFLFVCAEAILICQRTKKASAFSQANVKSLGRIVIALLAAGAVLLWFGQFVMDYLLAGLPQVGPVLRVGLPSFAVVVIALMIRAVQLLMRRALAMQEENELTV